MAMLLLSDFHHHSWPNHIDVSQRETRRTQPRRRPSPVTQGHQCWDRPSGYSLTSSRNPSPNQNHDHFPAASIAPTTYSTNHAQLSDVAVASAGTGSHQPATIALAGRATAFGREISDLREEHHAMMRRITLVLTPRVLYATLRAVPSSPANSIKIKTLQHILLSRRQCNLTGEAYVHVDNTALKGLKAIQLSTFGHVLLLKSMTGLGGASTKHSEIFIYSWQAEGRTRRSSYLDHGHLTTFPPQASQNTRISKAYNSSTTKTQITNTQQKRLKTSLPPYIS
ncbi:hypothetical protein BDZ89DRAFT_1112692 [Hymenopellis radicata]|nr:hypothetical protein BDZ89DRAFT_1112692 [Hymenopellis radicata]